MTGERPDGFLAGDLDDFSKLLGRYELFKRVLRIPGDFVEAGVLRGEGLLAWAGLLEIFGPRSRRRVVGFDTFDGFPLHQAREYERPRSESLNEEIRRLGGSSVEEVAARAASLGLAHRIELVPGEATETIPRYVREQPGFRVALLNLDFDTYEPTRAALEHLYPRIVPGGVLIFDQYAVRGWGESDAVDEYLQANGALPLRSLPWVSGPKAYLRKPGKAPAA